MMLDLYRLNSVDTSEFHNNNNRYFRIAGITICVESELDLAEVVFKPEFSPFSVDGPGDDNVIMRHHFFIPDVSDVDLGLEIYRKVPWAIYRNDLGWTYQGINASPKSTRLQNIAFFNSDHTLASIYHPPRFKKEVRGFGWYSLSLFPTDQVWLAPLFADRSAVMVHSAGAILNRQGFLFIGHSNAGKSTLLTLLKQAAIRSNLNGRFDVEILCDDRNVVRRCPDTWRIYGTWSHGDVSEVSGSSAPLRGLFFLKQDVCNKIVHITDRMIILRQLLATLIKPLQTVEWWQKELDVLEQIAVEVPCYTLHFDKSGNIVEDLIAL